MGITPNGQRHSETCRDGSRAECQRQDVSSAVRCLALWPPSPRVEPRPGGFLQSSAGDSLSPPGWSHCRNVRGISAGSALAVSRADVELGLLVVSPVLTGKSSWVISSVLGVGVMPQLPGGGRTSADTSGSLCRGGDKAPSVPWSRRSVSSVEKVAHGFVSSAQTLACGTTSERRRKRPGDGGRKETAGGGKGAEGRHASFRGRGLSQ